MPRGHINNGNKLAKAKALRDLRSKMDADNVLPEEAALEMGFSPSCVNGWLRGKGSPHSRSQAKIHAWTGTPPHPAGRLAQYIKSHGRAPDSYEGKPTAKAKADAKLGTAAPTAMRRVRPILGKPVGEPTTQLPPIKTAALDDAITNAILLLLPKLTTVDRDALFEMIVERLAERRS